jgi:hypothetical protein
MTFAKLSRRRVIELFVRHRYFYNQGNNTMTTLSVIPIEKIAIILAVAKYLLGDHVDMKLVYAAAGAYFIWRIGLRWVIGYIWHRSDGYDIETEWNKGKVPPSRVEVINWEEGFNFHRVWAQKLYKDITAKKEPFDWSVTIQGQACSKSFPGDACLGSEDSCPECKEAPRKKKPDWVHPDDGWRPEPNSGRAMGTEPMADAEGKG